MEDAKYGEANNMITEEGGPDWERTTTVDVTEGVDPQMEHSKQVD